MARTSDDQTLRQVLIIDALTCLCCGALMTLGAEPLAAWTALPVALLRYAGASLFPIAALMAFSAQRGPGPSALVWLLIAGNALWTLASVALALSGWVAPNALGYAFLLGQAAVVLLLTILEYRCVRNKSARHAPGAPRTA